MGLIHGFLDHKRRCHTPWQFSLQVVSDVRQMDAGTPKRQILYGIEQFSLWCIRHLPCKHKVMNDQCGIPEHRFCEFCFKLMPNAEVGVRQPKSGRWAQRPHQVKRTGGSFKGVQKER